MVFGVVVDFAGGTDGADLVDQEVLNGLIAVVLISDGVGFEDTRNIIVLIRKANDIDFFILSFQLIGDAVNILHGVVVFVFYFLQIELHDKIGAFLVPIHLPVHNVVPSACELDPVDVVDDWVDLVELYVEVALVVDKLRLDVDDFDSAEL